MTNRIRDRGMMAKQDTKEKILAAGAAIIHNKGFNNTGIQEILTAAGVPKGSFYFYFKSKEDFGLQLIDFFEDIIFSKFDEYLSAIGDSPVKKLRQSFEGFSVDFEQNEFRGGCPIGNLSQEMGDLNDDFREKLNGVLDRVKDKIGEYLRDAKKKQEVSPSLDIDETADFILSSFQGALLQAKVAKSAVPLRVFEKTIFETVLKQ